MDYNIFEGKKGRPTMSEVTKENKNETNKEKLKEAI